MIPFSIALIDDLSYGVTVSRRASLAEIEASCLSGRVGAVVVDHHAVEQRRGRAPGADGRHLVLDRVDGLDHALCRVIDQLFEKTITHVRTTVPTRSPHTIRSMFRSSSMLKT